MGEVPEPGGETIEVLAAAINPIDVAVSRGVLAIGHPELPYVPGCEAVGRAADGRMVWIFGGTLGRTSPGTVAQQAAVGDAHMVEVPNGADPALAAGLGIAGLAGWLPFAWRAPLRPGENVLVLGATGSVGLIAVQTAKLLGAGRIVAAGRSAAGLERAMALGADSAVRLEEQADLVDACKSAFGGDGIQANSLALLQQYQKMSSEERSVLGFTEDYANRIVANYRTAASIQNSLGSGGGLAAYL